MKLWEVVEVLISLGWFHRSLKKDKTDVQRTSQSKRPEAFACTLKFPSKVYRETFLMPERISKGPQVGKHGGA